jgi:uncharacterized RDD family membrane protein YckC
MTDPTNQQPATPNDDPSPPATPPAPAPLEPDAAAPTAPYATPPITPSAPPPAWSAPAAAGAPPVAWEAPPTVDGPAPGIEFANPGSRLVAYIIDVVILTFIVGGLIVVGAIIAGLGSDFDIDPVTGDIVPGSLDLSSGSWLAFAVLTIIATIIAIVYFPWFWARGGQTPGMRAFGLAVVRDADGGPIGWGAALLRLVGMYVSSLVFYLGFIWIFIDKRKRGWHDLIAGTVVIKRS